MGVWGGVGLAKLPLDSLGLSSMGVYIFMQDVKVKSLLLQASINTCKHGSWQMWGLALGRPTASHGSFHPSVLPASPVIQQWGLPDCWMSWCYDFWLTLSDGPPTPPFLPAASWAIAEAHRDVSASRKDSVPLQGLTALFPLMEILFWNPKHYLEIFHQWLKLIHS